MTNNPDDEVEYISGGNEGHHTWTVEQVRKYWEAHPLGTMARLAIDLMLFTGVRRARIAADSMHLLVLPENETASPVSHPIAGTVSHLRKKWDASMG